MFWSEMDSLYLNKVVLDTDLHMRVNSSSLGRAVKLKFPAMAKETS